MADANISINAVQLKTVKLKPLALAAAGLTGADVERLIREARQKARREQRRLSYGDIQTAFTAGQAAMPPDIIWRIAIHESGHALAYELSGIADVQTMSIGNGNGGFVASKRKVDRIENEAWLDQYLTCILAGRAAEKLVFGDTVMGSGGNEVSDLARATKLATDAETACGFGKTQPLLYRSVQDQPSLLSLDRQLAGQVHARLEAAERRAMELLSNNRGALLALATRLAQAKVLDGSEVKALLSAEANVAAENPEGLAP
jgi:cell division protease FtsH